MNEFLTAFFPNLASTIVGVAVGLPIALYINKRLLKQQNEIAKEYSKNRLNEVASVLIDACRYNIKVLDRISELAVTARVMRNPDLRTTTWDALSHTVIEHLSDPSLLQFLSHHWLRLQRFEELNLQIFSRESGSAAQLTDENMILEYWGELYQTACELSRHSHELIGKLEELQLDT